MQHPAPSPATHATDSATSWVTVGYVMRPHGVQGAMRLRTELPWHALRGVVACVRLARPEVPGEVFVLADVRDIHDGVLLRVESVASPESAKLHQGSVVQVQAQHIPPCETGEYYLADAVHAQVLDEQGTACGIVTSVTDNGGQPLAVLDHGGQERLLPLVPAFVVRFDRAAHTLHVRVPLGLWDEA